MIGINFYRDFFFIANTEGIIKIVRGVIIMATPNGNALCTYQPLYTPEVGSI